MLFVSRKSIFSVSWKSYIPFPVFCIDPYQSIQKLSYQKPRRPMTSQEFKKKRRAQLAAKDRKPRKCIIAPDGTILPRDAYQRARTPGGYTCHIPVVRSESFNFQRTLPAVSRQGSRGGSQYIAKTLPMVYLDPPNVPQLNPFAYPGHITQVW